MNLRRLLVLVLTFTYTIQTKHVPVLTSTNIALKKPSSQSSTQDGHADKAVDGEIRQTHSYCSTTGADDQAWWSVDLLEAFDIACLKLYSREGKTRLSDFKIFVGNEIDKNIEYAACYKHMGVLKVIESYLPCWTTTRYRYVKIQLDSYAKSLSICEVMIYSKEDMPNECQEFSISITTSTETVSDVIDTEIKFLPSRSLAPDPPSMLYTKPSEEALSPISSTESLDMTDYSTLTSTQLKVVIPPIDLSASHDFNLTTPISNDVVPTGNFLYPSVNTYTSVYAVPTSDLSETINSRFTTGHVFQSISTRRVNLGTSIYGRSNLASEEWSNSDDVTMTSSSDWSMTSVTSFINKTMYIDKEMACLCGCKNKTRFEEHYPNRWKLPLRLKKTEMSLYRRSKESAKNLKFTSKCIGAFGLGIVVALSVLILVVDLNEIGTNLFCFKFKSNQVTKRVGQRF